MQAHDRVALADLVDGKLLALDLDEGLRQQSGGDGLRASAHVAHLAQRSADRLGSRHQDRTGSTRSEQIPQ